jgi:hypothetical protein
METMMKMAEITWNRGRRSFPHNHTVALSLDSLDWSRFRAFAEGSNEVTILDAAVDADRVAVRCGCSTAEICGRLWDAWA